MRLDPSECVDGDLWFAPHLYDRSEIRFLRKRMREDGVFVDVGANVGFWSLLFANVFPRARICAIEANPATFRVLSENIEINVFQNITALNMGVSDNVGELPLYCNDTGNRGGDSFSETTSDRTRRLMIPIKPLAAILAEANLESVDVLKMDIEGFEERVLNRKEAPQDLIYCLRAGDAKDDIGVAAVLRAVTEANHFTIISTMRLAALPSHNSGTRTTPVD